ncbi:hypothetical protein L596_000519 [Steinernema carpocapsae]|uniref:Uncharacterized protein n=1 Tax=Steinernema carpocapsae TaxID=34508 RepID=A0A4U8UIF6_STECR|nr:hypothetical protein L596_000519 [Steinernema carpocapsae]
MLIETLNVICQVLPERQHDPPLPGGVSKLEVLNSAAAPNYQSYKCKKVSDNDVRNDDNDVQKRHNHYL